MHRLALPFRSAAVALACLGAVELGFRAAGLFDPTELHDPYLGFRGTAPLYRLEADGDGSEVRRTSPNKRRAYRDVSFPGAKPKDELRVFCVGGSSLQLQSFSSPPAAFPDFLQFYLEAWAPQRTVRVVNSGGGATGSVQNLEVVREVLGYGPDLLLIYPEGGEKNLIPPAPAGLLALRDEASPARVAVRSLLAPLRVYAAARESLAALRPRDPGGPFRSAFSAIAASVYAGPFDRDSFALYFEFKDDRVPVLMPHVIPQSEIERGHARYRRNLGRMVDLAEQHGVPLVFVLPQRNAESSFYARFHIDPSEIRPGELDTWRRLYEQGLEAKRAGRFEEAVDRLERVRATYVEDRDDILAWYLAECHAALGRREEARREYALGVRRHPILAILREVARERGVPLIDPWDALVEAADGGVPGHDWFVDSVHPLPAGGRVIARAIADGLVEQHVVPGLAAPSGERRSEVEARCDERVAAATEVGTPVNWHILRAIRAGDLDEAVRLGAGLSRDELIFNPVDLFTYGWALVLDGRMDEARALFEDSRAFYIDADTLLPTLDGPEDVIEFAFSGDVFAFF
ncbi:MAG TPA: hypothetical protein VMT18_01195 [Planctomycetota bacterium]|nr:hypothetical protein [Planctomycetota bacterium]